MSIYSEILSSTKEKKVLSLQEAQKVKELQSLLLRHEEALDAALEACNKISNEADKVEALGSVKAEHIRATASIRKEIEDITGTPVPITESISKVLDNASDITIKFSGEAGAAIGKVLKTPAHTIGGFFKRLAKEIEG